MVDVVQDVKAEVTIIFKNGDTYEMPLSDGVTSLNNYCTSIDIDEQLYKNSSNNVVGNVCGNTMSLNLVSRDKLLIPNNDDSIYSGMMDNTAMVEVTFKYTYYDRETERNVNVEEFMGRYFVDTWEGGTDASRSQEVSISAVDLFSKVKNIPLTKMRTRRWLSFDDYIKYVINTLNRGLPEVMQVHYRDADLDIYKNSNYEWQMEYNNIDRDTVEVLFNSIAKDSISYIWIDRDGYLQTDHLLDDTASESVCLLSGSKNLLEYNVQAGAVNNYSGVSVKYIENITLARDLLLDIKDATLDIGDNLLSERKMKSDKVYNIDEIAFDSDTAQTLHFDYYKDKLDLYINAGEYRPYTIKVYGTYIIEDYGTVIRYKDEDNKDTIIEMENRVLRKELINRYVNGLINLMSCKNAQVQCTGFINPSLRTGNTCHFIGSRFNVNAYYKVVGLKFSLSGASYRCTANLIKTVETEETVDDILCSQMEQLYNAAMGAYIDINSIQDVTDAQDAYIMSNIGDLLNELKETVEE